MNLRPILDDGAFCLPATQGMEIVVIDKKHMRDAADRATKLIDMLRHDSEFRTPLDDLAYIALETLNDAVNDPVDPMQIDEYHLLSGAIQRIYLD